MDNPGLVAMCEMEGWKHKLGAVERPQGRQPHRVGRIGRSESLTTGTRLCVVARGALLRRRCIIKAVATRHSRYHKWYEKFGLELPKTIKRVLEIDRTTGTDFWRQAIIKEMGNIDPCIDLIPEGKDPPPGYDRLRH